MTLELRVLSGTRVGDREQFDKSVVTVGRHAQSDFRLDPHGDLDVSTRHAELRCVNGVWAIYDQSSTNGTYVNGKRVEGERRLADGDVVSFGANGPRVEVHGVGEAGGALAAAPSFQTRISPTAPAPVIAPRMDTSMRVAVAVHEQTKSMRRGFAAAAGALVAAAAMAFFFSQRQADARERELTAILARSESTMVSLQAKIAATRPADSAIKAAYKSQLDAGKRELASARAQIAAGTATKGAVELLSQRMVRTAQMDLPKVIDANDAAVAMVASDFAGKFLAGTAFGITAGGMLATNRHVVRAQGGVAAQRIMVIYANTKEWLPAHIVRSDDDDDLALIQIDVPGSYPVVAGVSRTGSLARVGAPVATIGYPGATDTPMEGSGMKITARTSTTLGTVSKRLDNVLQIDSYAGHGSSGSPVFDSAGNVVGVIWGGDVESRGRIVYAVPAQRLSAFLAADGATILR